ncbi:MAG: Extracellular solute-binding protein family 5 [Candidatus Yanofskybacteria bacterium GW2011_GWA1_44_21]|uniref:Solute-binding protein family 5 domain-containing protein n=2 Tax=Candidatus Yanofskyibacteriota TaxID=1752733 RepID=A0A1F8H0E5_9BACT|nr:MAG: Extracellular solute-binding protein family 5 [Candidatus Yanofskybacteria bacterium GW2011_GWA2_44_10]KKT50850.1 MAG: Extracellular solute-binding protein family 5 [Candidatus Yanofskybacteria bacterium GW2011_GWA1_44_21]KKT90423.1 MAG: Extracellular solute-binding protein family 5 [Candidatus Yanofskybacteria bacterium GW2011_GWB1_45_11]OGN02596.1 MAG: hypothetical protein A2657_00435 [Candidatus Yanofskybacteria bacterium RIFCSPHIGHO2_01_FULL_44_110b]OGN14228.1 MAG: hypothetical prot
MRKDDNQLDDFFGLKPELPEKRPKESRFKKIKSKIKLIPKVLSKKERYVIFLLLILMAGAVISIPFTTYNRFTTAQAEYGGSFTEGVIGEPRHINPLLSQTNDADRDLVSLIYSGLLKYNENGKLIPALAKSYEISSDGLNYTVYLKPNAVWHDGRAVTAGDIIFTVNAAQNPDYGSLQRINWQGVEVEKINDTAVMFKLKNKYAQFLNNLTLPIIPEHIWSDVKPINFALSDLNLKPIGSGPYQFKKLKKDSSGRVVSYELESNKKFYDGRPYVDKMTIQFYGTEDELIDAYNKNEVANLGYISPQNLKKIKFKQRLHIEELKLPRYFAVFFNTSQSRLLADKNIRLALNYGTDKGALVKTILDDKGNAVNSPLVGEVTGMSDIQKYSYDPDMAKKILAATGWGNPDENGILSKNKDSLKLTLVTSTWPELSQVANILKDQWKKIGVDLDVKVYPTTSLQDAIKNRDYQMLLFGEILTIDPDPFSLWHSSQKREPGLNLALYDNKTADNILEDARQTLNPLERMKKYDDFQKILVEDAPAVFLYNPYYIYAHSKNIRGFESKIISMPSDRFVNVEKWYINTKRTFN